MELLWIGEHLGNLFVALTHMWDGWFLSSESVTQLVNLLQTLLMTCEVPSFTFSKSPAGGRRVNTSLSISVTLCLLSLDLLITAPQLQLHLILTITTMTHTKYRFFHYRETDFQLLF